MPKKKAQTKSKHRVPYVITEGLPNSPMPKPISYAPLATSVGPTADRSCSDSYIEGFDMPRSFFSSRSDD